MNYDNKILGYENSQHPMHDEEQEITIDHVMGRLTIDEADFLENHITNLVSDAKKTNEGFKYRFQEAQKLQAEINDLHKQMTGLNILTWGKTEVEYNAYHSKLYKQICDKQDELNHLLTL